MIDFLMSLDTLVIVILIFGGFLWYELYSGAVSFRGGISILRHQRPFLYWLMIFIQFVILGITIYAWLTGLRIPVAELFD